MRLRGEFVWGNHIFNRGELLKDSVALGILLSFVFYFGFYCISSAERNLPLARRAPATGDKTRSVLYQ